MKPDDILVAAVGGLPSAGAVGRLTSLVCSARGDTGRRRWILTVAAVAVSYWAVVAALLALLLA